MSLWNERGGADTPGVEASVEVVAPPGLRRVGPAAAEPTRSESSVGSWRAAWAVAGRSERAVAVGALVLGVAAAPRLGIGSWPVELLVAVSVGAVGLPRLAALAAGLVPVGAGDPRVPARHRVAAAALLGWLAVGFVSALAGPRPALALVGLYAQSAGWVLMAAVAGWWALGTSLSSRGRRLVAEAVVVAALVNGVVALGQVTVGLSRVGLPGFGNGQAMGLQGNPVFLGGLEAGAVVLLLSQAWRQPITRRRWVTLAVVGLAVGASGERLSVLVVLATSALVAGATSARVTGLACRLATQRRRSAEGETGSVRRQGWLGRGLEAWSRGPRDPHTARLVAAAATAAAVAGALLPDIRHAHELTRKLGTSAEGTFGDRLHAWLEGLRALAHHPLIGVGPGQFQAATSSLFPLWFVRSHPNQVFTDAHDLVVEYAVTTGLLGVACLVTWLVAAGRRWSGPLAGFALAVLAVELVEPVNVVLTPLLFLAIGAACVAPRDEPAVGVADRAGRAELPPDPTRRRSSGWVRWVMGACAAVAGIAGAGFGLAVVVGSRAIVVAEQDRVLANHAGALAAATLADRLLSPWPQPAAELALVDLLGQQKTPTAPTPLELAARWEQVAAERDPANAPAWVDAAGLDLELGRRRVAAADARQALRFEPWDVGALQELGDIALDDHDLPAATAWFERLVEVRPRPTVAALLAGGCQGSFPGHRLQVQALRSCQ
jgi:hypothetical protein